MDLLPISDLHFEFHPDGGANFVRNLPDADVVILAGDIAVGKGITKALSFFCKKYPHVIYVHGNHEFYKNSLGDVRKYTKQAIIKHTHLHWLDGNYPIQLEVRGVKARFIGAPLWFRKPNVSQNLYDYYKRGMSDFSVIPDFESWVYEENKRQVDFLQAKMLPGDIVVTHHLPSYGSVAPQFVGSPLNHFFVWPMATLISERRPAMWIHGHTHVSCDYTYDITDPVSTRVYCNPYGYPGLEVNPDFVPRIITV